MNYCRTSIFFFFKSNPVPGLLIGNQDVYNTITRRGKTDLLLLQKAHGALQAERTSVNIVHEQKEEGRGIERSSREKVKLRRRLGSHCSYFPKRRVSYIRVVLGEIGTLFLWEKKAKAFNVLLKNFKVGLALDTLNSRTQKCHVFVTPAFYY